MAVCNKEQTMRSILRETALFILYWCGVVALTWRNLKQHMCQLYTNTFTKDCDHKWVATSTLERKRQGVYANCARCKAQR